MMATFADKLERVWTIRINDPVIQRVKELAKVNLYEVLDGELMQRLSNDLALFGAVIYAAVKPEADANNITPEQFGELLTGDAFDRAEDALHGALLDFFPSQKRRVLAAMLAKRKALLEKTVTATLTYLGSEQADKDFDAALKSRVRISGAVAESSESIQVS